MLTGIGIALYLSSSDHSTNLMILIIAAGYLFQIFQTIEFYFQSKVLSKYVAISQIIAWTLVSSGRAFCAWQGYPLIYFAGLEALNMCLMASGYLVFYIIKAGHPFHWRFDSGTAGGLLKASWPLLLSSAAGIIYMRIDQVMIKAMLGNTEVGYYAVAVRLSELWYFIPTVICSSFFPAVIRSREVSQQHYYGRLQKLYDLLAVFSIALSIGVMIVSPLLIEFLYGKSYGPASGVLDIYIWTMLTLSLGSILGQWMLIENLQILLMYTSIAAALFNVIFNYIFIKLSGLNGAAWATLITPFFSGLLILLFCRKTEKQFRMMLKAIFFIWVFKTAKHLKGN
jgi:O-antigen/teichoic acid export membrane protein